MNATPKTKSHTNNKAPTSRSEMQSLAATAKANRVAFEIAILVMKTVTKEVRYGCLPPEGSVRWDYGEVVLDLTWVEGPSGKPKLQEVSFTRKDFGGLVSRLATRR